MKRPRSWSASVRAKACACQGSANTGEYYGPSGTTAPDQEYDPRFYEEAPLDAPAVSSAGDAPGPGEGVPEADALEQQLSARPGEAGSPLRPVGDREANEADVLEQDADVPVDDDDVLS